METIINLLSKQRFDVQNEKVLQSQIEEILKVNNVYFDREFRFDRHNIIDFKSGNVGIEVKISGTKKGIYKQCERYCNFDELQYLILITNKSIGLPKLINGKKTHIINLGNAWL